MVMTILESNVPPEKWVTLKQTYAEGTKRLPLQIMETYLNQSSADPTLWQIISVWRSRGDLNEYRKSVETTGGVLMFRAVNVEPTLSIFDVRDHANGMS